MKMVALKPFGFLMIWVSFLLQGCNSGHRYEQYIPESAPFVGKVNARSLGKKMALSAFLNHQSAPFPLLEYLPFDPNQDRMQNLGISLSSPIYFFEDTSGAFHFLLDIKKVDQWESHIHQLPQIQSLSYSTGFRYTRYGQDHWMAWNDHALLLSFFRQGQHVQEREKVACWNKVFSQHSGKSFSSSSFFKTRGSSSDLRCWIKGSYYYQRQLQDPGFRHFIRDNPSLDILAYKELWHDLNGYVQIDFKKDHLNIDLEIQLNKKWKDIFKYTPQDKSDDQLIKSLPRENLDIIWKGHINPSGIVVAMKDLSVFAFLNRYFKQDNELLQQAPGLFTGHYVTAWYNMRYTPILEAKNTSPNRIEYIPQSMDWHAGWLMGFQVSDSLQVHEWLSRFVSPEFSYLDEGLWAFQTGAQKNIFYLLNNDCLVLTNDIALGESYITGDYATEDFPPPYRIIAEKPSTHIFIGSNAISLLYAAFQPGISDQESQENNPFDHLSVRQNKLDDDLIGLTMRLQLKPDRSHSILETFRWIQPLLPSTHSFQYGNPDHSIKAVLMRDQLQSNYRAD